MAHQHIYAFGAFRLDPQQKILLRDGERLPLHPKTFATLLALLESSGAVITKDDLLAQVWPGTFVEESSLTKNISLLRKTLNNGHAHSDYIETIPTVGYRFVEPVQQVERGETASGRQGDGAKAEQRETLPPLASRFRALLLPRLRVAPSPHRPVALSPHRIWLWGALALVLFVGASLAWFK